MRRWPCLGLHHLQKRLSSQLGSLQKNEGSTARKLSALTEERARQAASRTLGEQCVPGLLARSPQDLVALLPEQALPKQLELARGAVARLVNDGVPLELLRSICRALQVRGARLALPARCWALQRSC